MYTDKIYLYPPLNTRLMQDLTQSFYNKNEY
jgi:hypothetical protein